MALHHAGQADGKRLHRELQRQVAGRMPERALVRKPWRGAGDHRGLADGLQQRPVSQFPELPDAGGICSFAAMARARLCRTRGGRSARPLPKRNGKATTRIMAMPDTRTVENILCLFITTSFLFLMTLQMPQRPRSSVSFRMESFPIPTPTFLGLKCRHTTLKYHSSICS